MDNDRIWAHTVRHITRAPRKKGISAVLEQESAWVTPKQGVTSLVNAVSYMYTGGPSLIPRLTSFYDVEVISPTVRKIRCPGWVHEALIPFGQGTCSDLTLQRMFFIWLLGTTNLRLGARVFDGILTLQEDEGSWVKSFMLWLSPFLNFKGDDALLEARFREMFQDGFPLGFDMDSPFVRYLNFEPVDVEDDEDDLEVTIRGKTYVVTPHALERMLERDPLATPKNVRQKFTNLLMGARRVYRKNSVTQVIKHDFEVATYLERHGWVFVVAGDAVKTCYYKGTGKTLKAAGYKASPWA